MLNLITVLFVILVIFMSLKVVALVFGVGLLAAFVIVVLINIISGWLAYAWLNKLGNE